MTHVRSTRPVQRWHWQAGLRWMRRASVTGWLLSGGVTGTVAFAQGTVERVVLQTGGGSPLISRSVPLQAPTLPMDILRFEFGFATDEQFGPGRIFDSFTITIQSRDQVTALVVVTVDAGGVVYAPGTPGTAPVNPEAVQRAPVEFPSLEPVLSMQVAQQVSLALPDTLLGQPLDVFFDLFDNQDSVRSIAYFHDVALVPEPRAWIFLAGGLAAIFTFRMQRQR